MIPFPVHLFVILCDFGCIIYYITTSSFYFTTLFRRIKSYHDFSHSSFHIICHCNVRHNVDLKIEYKIMYLANTSYSNHFLCTKESPNLIVNLV